MRVKGIKTKFEFGSNGYLGILGVLLKNPALLKRKSGLDVCLSHMKILVAGAGFEPATFGL
jgi:hypothetical protein